MAATIPTSIKLTKTQETAIGELVDDTHLKAADIVRTAIGAWLEAHPTQESRMESVMAFKKSEAAKRLANKLAAKAGILQ